VKQVTSPHPKVAMVAASTRHAGRIFVKTLQKFFVLIRRVGAFVVIYKAVVTDSANPRSSDIFEM
jgi:hypothetical protein